jgi:AcrR family transcriptional regulator
MPGDAQATQQRLIAAATAEFAAHGLAGARVDRIAAAAGANKAQIYHYFGSKDALFDAVFSRRVIEFADAVAFDAADLPGYAGRSFDMYEENPDIVRLTTWYQLERPDGAPIRTVLGSSESKLAEIAEAQRNGQLQTDRDPLEILAFVRSVAMAWHTQVPELDARNRLPRAQRRAAVVEAVTRLISSDESQR